MKKSTLITSLFLAGSFMVSSAVLQILVMVKVKTNKLEIGHSNSNTIKMTAKKTNATTQTMIETATEAIIDTTIVVVVAT